MIKLREVNLRLYLLLRYALFASVVLGTTPAVYAGGENNTRDRWAETLTYSSDSVVALEIARVRPFDFSEQGISTATGFVVDAENGIILTNRHVVGSGPITATATFQNQEQVRVVPLYRDTVHDFGFLRYDPRELEFIKPRALPLRADKAATGLDDGEVSLELDARGIKQFVRMVVTTVLTAGTSPRLPLMGTILFGNPKETPNPVT